MIPAGTVDSETGNNDVSHTFQHVVSMMVMNPMGFNVSIMGIMECIESHWLCFQSVHVSVPRVRCAGILGIMMTSMVLGSRIMEICVVMKIVQFSLKSAFP